MSGASERPAGCAVDSTTGEAETHPQRDLGGRDLAALLRRHYGYEIVPQTGSHLRLATTGRRPQPPRMPPSSPWSKGRRSAWNPRAPHVRGAQATSTFVEPIAAGGGTGSPCSRNDWTCRGIASAMSCSPRHGNGQPPRSREGQGHTRPKRRLPARSRRRTQSPLCLPDLPACRQIDPSVPTALRHLAYLPPSPFPAGQGGGTGGESRPACRGASRRAPEYG